MSSLWAATLGLDFYDLLYLKQMHKLLFIEKALNVYRVTVTTCFSSLHGGFSPFVASSQQDVITEGTNHLKCALKTELMHT